MALGIIIGEPTQQSLTVDSLVVPSKRCLIVLCSSKENLPLQSQETMGTKQRMCWLVSSVLEALLLRRDLVELGYVATVVLWLWVLQPLLHVV
jgi:hypothetical protein